MTGPRARDQGPGTRDQGAGTQGPGTRDQGPGTRDQGPGNQGTRDEGPGTRGQGSCLVSLGLTWFHSVSACPICSHLHCFPCGFEHCLERMAAKVQTGKNQKRQGSRSSTQNLPVCYLDSSQFTWKPKRTLSDLPKHFSSHLRNTNHTTAERHMFNESQKHAGNP